MPEKIHVQHSMEPVECEPFQCCIQVNFLMGQLVQDCAVPSRPIAPYVIGRGLAAILEMLVLNLVSTIQGSISFCEPAPCSLQQLGPWMLLPLRVLRPGLHVHTEFKCDRQLAYTVL